MCIGVKAVKPLKHHRLLLSFEDGEQRIFGVQPYLSRGIFAELREPGRFNAVRVSFKTVEWPNGADLCPEALYEESVPAEELSATEV